MNVATPGDFVVDSVTGVDVSLPIAGTGGRSFAFIIDWHFRLLLALAWFFAGSFIDRRLGDGVPGGSTYAFAVVVPSLVLYFLYHPVLEIAMRGRTPGKRIAGVRIVTRHGATPGFGPLLTRNVFRLIDSLPAFYCLGFAFTLFSAQHVRIGDIAAGTLLIYDRSGGRDPLAALPGAAPARLSPQLVELTEDLLARWDELGYDARGDLARRILDRADPRDGQHVPHIELRPRLRALLAAEPK